MQAKPKCTALRVFWKIWETSTELRDTFIARKALAVFVDSFGAPPSAARTAQSGSPQGTSPLLQRLYSNALRLIGILDKRAEDLRKQLSRELKVFEAVFVARVYEEECPEECLSAFKKLSEELKWESTVLSSYTAAANSVGNLGERNAFTDTLRNYVTIAREKHREAFENLSFLCPRLLMLTQDVFDALIVLTTEELACKA